MFFQKTLAKSDFMMQSVTLVSLHLHPPPVPNDINGCIDGDRSIRVNKCVCVCACMCVQYLERAQLFLVTGGEEP